MTHDMVRVSRCVADVVAKQAFRDFLGWDFDGMFFSAEAKAGGRQKNPTKEVSWDGILMARFFRQRRRYA